MKLELYSDAVLTRDLPAHGLRKGDVVKIVELHPLGGGQSACSIEVFK